MTKGKLRDMEHTLPATAVAEVASDAPALLCAPSCTQSMNEDATLTTEGKLRDMEHTLPVRR